MDRPEAAPCTILVIDDAPENLMLMSTLLKDRCRVKVANGGVRGLALVVAAALVGAWLVVLGAMHWQGAQRADERAKLLQQTVDTLQARITGGGMLGAVSLLGLSEPLWRRQQELVRRAADLVDRCDCKAGCPACVGPVLAADEDAGTTPRALARRVLHLLDAA